ncbi:hypothetical protein L3Q65_00330 (plasmid) [Amycolatopsis sp. FU40]|uniref:hypothetical protein n=1 Tax=Amycolatopsis sp. FU40 TaxID=2914159 RepID=UPI001F2E7FAC|nr:hypothetical protein [Amycolatopsis sp. FU40]UKD50776.1 hypothetical protein L3Q65_00330 [Amycolatopsis sp. FU40]
MTTAPHGPVPVQTDTVLLVALLLTAECYLLTSGYEVGTTMMVAATAVFLANAATARTAAAAARRVVAVLRLLVNQFSP